MTHPVALVGALTLLLITSACSGGLSVRADGCWGQGAGDCLGAQAVNLRALGFESGALAALSSGLQCGGTVDCQSALAAAPKTKRPTSVPAAASSPSGSDAAVAGTAAVAVDAPGEAAAADETGPSDGAEEPVAARDSAGAESAAPVAEQEAEAQEGSEPVAMVSGGGGSAEGSCSGLQIAGMERKASLSKAEVTCLLAAATGQVDAPDAERQTAAVALYNAKVAGWPKAVEAALGQASLRNAPALNFAGLKPAYDAGRYSQVLQRADRVWTNFKRKGYQLSASDKTFVLEYACRSAFQLHQSGKTADKGAEWCEGWLDRLERAGADMSQAQDIYDQLN